MSHAIGNGPNYHFRWIKSHFEVVPRYMYTYAMLIIYIKEESYATEIGKVIMEKL